LTGNFIFKIALLSRNFHEIALVIHYLTKTLKLKVNLEKSAVDKPCNRKFLGFSFSKGKKPNRIKVHESRIKRFKDRVKEILKQCKGNKLFSVIEEKLMPMIRGWINYFGLAEARSIFSSLDSWIRRKVRCALWKQWKTTKKRFKELLKLGAQRKETRNIVSSGKGAWRISKTECMHKALRNRTLENMRLIPMMKMIKG
jgi:RNA-directed DNA polymerase